MCVCVWTQVCEKESLLRERKQLRACMVDLRENVSCLSQSVQSEEQELPNKVQSIISN